MKPIKLIAFLFILTLTSCKETQKSTKEASKITSTYYFIRHAEKDRSDPENTNPDLTNEGLQRAENWSNILGKIEFDAVLSTNFTRTIKTATPTAKKNNVDITIYDPNELNIPNFLKDTQGKNILVVGHSNTTPKLVNAIIGKEIYEDINDSVFGNLYQITIINGKVSDYNLTTN